jgi:hypothetical protein
MGQTLTFIIAGAIFIYAAYIIWKNFVRVKKGQCPGGCGTCGKSCAYRDENTNDGDAKDDEI